MSEDDIIHFLRKRDYVLKKELGSGACGKTVLLHDDYIGEDYVCKKYSPYSESHRETLFANFVSEVRLLHQVFHPNVVRVFNHYLYPEDFAGYILMEYVEGIDIEDALEAAPETVNEMLLQAVEGFRYLESKGILHRDIRVTNLLIRKDGVLKIIDLGFGKRVVESRDFNKSISLNLWCEPPDEFAVSKYDFCTEVYFVGKLFQKIIQERGIESCKYLHLIKQMCESDPGKRIKSFFDVNKEIQNDKFVEIDFTQDEKAAYREFAEMVSYHATKIKEGAKYRDDIDRIQKDLESKYREFMLEEIVPSSELVIDCLVSGSYYRKLKGFPVLAVKNFISLLKGANGEKKRIILANLHTRLDAITRYSDPPPPRDEDDIPF